jgi:hypothetical protein
VHVVAQNFLLGLSRGVCFGLQERRSLGRELAAKVDEVERHQRATLLGVKSHLGAETIALPLFPDLLGARSAGFRSRRCSAQICPIDIRTKTLTRDSAPAFLLDCDGQLFGAWPIAVRHIAKVSRRGLASRRERIALFERQRFEEGL